MLMQTTFDTDHVWNKLQEPACPTGKPADHLLLLSALDEGWKILETARLVPFNDFLRGGSYMLTIFHPDSQKAPQRGGQFPGIDHFDELEW